MERVRQGVLVALHLRENVAQCVLELQNRYLFRIKLTLFYIFDFLNFISDCLCLKLVDVVVKVNVDHV